jgi:hypothetical protein
LSAAGPLVIGGEIVDPGHPVVGATVYLVPTTAMDISTQSTASAIYEAPYPAEAYDEPLEDAIRLMASVVACRNSAPLSRIASSRGSS